MKDIIIAIIFGIIQGVTEWLPISSTGHMILADQFLQLSTSTEFKEMFFVVIQLASIMAIIILFWKKIFPFKFKGEFIDKSTFILWSKILIACIPAGVLGVLFNDWLDEKLYNFVIVSLMLILYGLFFIDVENFNRMRTPRVNELNEIAYKDALIIGLFQVLALVPGTSRSGATIVGSLLIGIARSVAAEFSFFLAIPVMMGASLLKILKFGFHFTSTELIVLGTGCLVSFAVSLLVVRFIMNFVKSRDFKPFGIYRIVLGAIVLLYFTISFFGSL